MHDFYQIKFTKDTDGTPVRRLATPWLPCNLGFFRIDLSIIRPQSEKPKGYLTLGRGKTQRVCQALSDAVELLKKELR